MSPSVLHAEAAEARGDAIKMVARLETVVGFAGLVFLSGSFSGPLGGWWAESGGESIVFLLFPVYALCGLMLTFRTLRLGPVLRRNPLLLLVPLFAVASCLWSVDTAATFRRSAALFGTYFFGTYLAMRFDLRTITRLMAYVAIAVAVVTLLAVSLVPGQAIMTGAHEGAWRGGFDQKNGLGGIMALGVLACIATYWVSPKHRLQMVFGILLCTISLLGSRSVTGLVVAVGSVLVLASAKFIIRLPLLALIPSGIVFFSALAVGGYQLIVNWGPLLTALGRDPTLTGRTTLWGLLLLDLLERPMLGYGYGAYWTPKNVADTGIHLLSGWDAPHAHLGILDVALSLGVVGAVLFSVAFLWSIARNIRGARISEEGVFALSYLAFFFVRNLSESNFVRHNSLYFALFVCVAYVPYRASLNRMAMTAETVPLTDVSNDD